MFKKEEHGLTYHIVVEARNKVIYFTLQAYRLDTGANVCDLDRWVVTEQGFPVTDEKGNVEAYVNAYDEVIGYLKGDGSFTEEGIEWAKNTPLNGVTVGDYIK